MPPSEDEIRRLLLKYIAGETNQEEVEQIEGWLKEDPEIFKEFEQLWDLWYAVGTATNVFRFNVDEGWNETLQRMRKSGSAQKRKRSVRRWLIAASSVAAALLLFLGFSFWRAGNLTHRGTSAVAALPGPEVHAEDSVAGYTRYDTKVQTPEGARRKMVLADGTRLWLNSGTSIHFFMDEKKQMRTVYLSGQAFFDIAQNAHMPFVVTTKHATIKVLGTRFNVSAYPNDSTVEATLIQGRILFKTTAHQQEVKQQLQPGQKIAINYLSGRLDISNVDTVFYSSWKEGKLIFRNQLFRQVARAMEHKYNTSIVFRSPALEYERLSGYLEKESLTEALDALQLTLRFQYRIKDGTVIISK